MGLGGRNGRKFGGEVGGTKPEREEIALCAGAGGCGWIRPARTGGQSGKLGLVRHSRTVCLPGYKLWLVFSHFSVLVLDSCESRNPDTPHPPFLRKIPPLT